MVPLVVRDTAETPECRRDSVVVTQFLGQPEAPVIQRFRAVVVALRSENASQIVERMRQAPPVFDRVKERHAFLEQRPCAGWIAVTTENIGQIV